MEEETQICQSTNSQEGGVSNSSPGQNTVSISSASNLTSTSRTTSVTRITTGTTNVRGPAPTNGTTRINRVNCEPHENDNDNLKICGINICGLNSKLNNGVFNDYIEEFDICCLTETKTSKGTNINNYTVFNLEKKSKKHVLPGIHGLQVYITDRIADQCYQINYKHFMCESALWINISDTFILGTLYVPCQSSKHYYPEFFEDLASDMCLIKDNYDLPFMLIGDFNSRTGTLNEIMIQESDNIVFDTTHFKYPDVIDILKSLNMPIDRSTKDNRKTNVNGRDLIEMCKLHELCIINGRMGKDKGIGSFTCDDKSLIDYALCTPDLLSKLTDFQVDKFDPLLSDKHNPINVYLNLAKPLYSKSTAKYTHISNENIIDKQHVKSKWDNQKADDFQNNFEMDKIHNISIELSSVNPREATVDTISSISDNLRDILIHPAKVTEMHKQVPSYTERKIQKPNKPWFNSLCRESKNNFKIFKKSLPNPLSDINKTKLMQHANRHKTLLRKEKCKFDKEFNEKLISLKTSNPGAYWKIINQNKKKH